LQVGLGIPRGSGAGRALGGSWLSGRVPCVRAYHDAAPNAPPARLVDVNRAVGSRWLALASQAPPSRSAPPAARGCRQGPPPRPRAPRDRQPPAAAQPRFEGSSAPCSAPRPAAPASFLSPCLRPPHAAARQESASGTRLGQSTSQARAAASGRLWHQALSSSLPALPRSCLACAAWSLLRERLTPRPPAAGGRYRFGFRQNKLGQLVGRRANRVRSAVQPC
jgi:hypothetical protein